MKIFIVVPFYNEEKRLKRMLDGIKGSKLEVVLVDDGSRDLSLAIAQKSGFDVIKHKVNLGKGAAMKTGTHAAFLKGADAVIFMDADGQHSLSDIPKFVKRLESEKYHIIFGTRKFDRNTPLERSLGNKVGSFLVNLLFGIKVTDLLCGFRALTKKAFEAIDWESVGYGVETEMVVKTGILSLSHCEVPVKTIYLDKEKGVSLIDALAILGSVLVWRLKL